MTTNDFERSLRTLLSELSYGSAPAGAYVLNPGDAGLLAALDALSAADASASRDGGATIAGHAEHLRYGLSLMNRWAAGENPFTDADWTIAWRTREVTEEQWADLRRRLRETIDSWHSALAFPREIAGVELDGVMASVVHMAYHLGAIRQIHAGTRGPAATASA